MATTELKQTQNGIRQFLNELQRFSIIIENNELTYNGYKQPEKYEVHLQNLYLEFNKALYAKLEEMEGEDEQIDYLKDLQLRLAEADEILLENRDLLAYFESMLALKRLDDYAAVIEKMEGMHVHLDKKTQQETDSEKIDTIAFIDKQINFSYKALSLMYNMITLESHIPSSYGMEQEDTHYRFKWKGSKEELAELFVELQRKKWIETLQPKDVEAAVKSIKQLFDLSRTSVKEQPSEKDPLTTYLKGQIEASTGKQTYPDIYRDNYKQKFNHIQPNQNN